MFHLNHFESYPRPNPASGTPACQVEHPDELKIYVETLAFKPFGEKKLDPLLEWPSRYGRGTVQLLETRNKNVGNNWYTVDVAIWLKLKWSIDSYMT